MFLFWIIVGVGIGLILPAIVRHFGDSPPLSPWEMDPMPRRLLIDERQSRHVEGNES